MNFNQHFDLIGKHAIFSPSQYHWINYDEEKMISRYKGLKAVEEGTRKHALAAELIDLGIRLPNRRKTLEMFVNDAIGYKMVPEQVLVYSNNFFGTCDAINQLDQILKKKILRIHDLKTGVTPAHMEQLEIYAALFCLEYRMKPSELNIELRLYQSDEVLIEKPEADKIVPIMDKIISFDNRLKREQAGE